LFGAGKPTWPGPGDGSIQLAGDGIAEGLAEDSHGRLFYVVPGGLGCEDVITVERPEPSRRA
jgi:hypothetical protein